MAKDKKKRLNDLAQSGFKSIPVLPATVMKEYNGRAVIYRLNGASEFTRYLAVDRRGNVYGGRNASDPSGLSSRSNNFGGIRR